MNSDVIINKVVIIERCLKRVSDVYADTPTHLQDFKNFTEQILINDK